MPVDQHLAVMALFLRHLFENAGGMRIGVTQRIGIGEIDAAVVLFGGDGERQDFLLAERFEAAFAGAKKAGTKKSATKSSGAVKRGATKSPDAP